MQNSYSKTILLHQLHFLEIKKSAKLPAVADKTSIDYPGEGKLQCYFGRILQFSFYDLDLN